MLTEQTRSVKFTKSNGEVRMMNCTLVRSAIPADEVYPENGGEDDRSLVVYDLDKKGWRQFKIANIISIQ